jgi:hypothetical protein
MTANGQWDLGLKLQEFLNLTLGSCCYIYALALLPSRTSRYSLSVVSSVRPRAGQECVSTREVQIVGNVAVFLQFNFSFLFLEFYFCFVSFFRRKIRFSE